MNQNFTEHCTAAATLMSRLAKIAKQLDEECRKMTPVSVPSDNARQLLLEAFGNIEAIRHAHMPFIEVADPIGSFVMSLSLKNVVRRVSEMACLFSSLEKRAHAAEARKRPKTLPKYLPPTVQA